MIIPTARPSRTWTHRSRAVTIAMASFMAVVPSLAAAQCGALEPGPTRVVTRVETSTTLRLDDGSEVVLVNVWPPTRIDNAAEDTWRPEQTARAALTTLVEGHSVDLAFSGRRMDRYGRHLAQVFVHDGTERIWVQGRVISDGWARAFALPGQLVCLDDLIAAERHARSNARGFWGDGVFQDQSAADARSLVRLRDTFQTVTGRVARVSQVRGETVLQLSPDGQSRCHHRDGRQGHHGGRRRRERSPDQILDVERLRWQTGAGARFFGTPDRSLHHTQRLSRRRDPRGSRRRRWRRSRASHRSRTPAPHSCAFAPLMINPQNVKKARTKARALQIVCTSIGSLGCFDCAAGSRCISGLARQAPTLGAL
jgi:endonuclease YncB( thermonuclease family)